MDYNYDFPKSKFYEALITGFFVGFFATVICLTFNIAYRTITGMPSSAFINVSVLIFSINLLFPVIGIIYYGFLSAFKKPDVFFIVLFLVLTGIFAWRSQFVHRSDDHLINSEFRTLLTVIVLILGLSATIFVPWLYNNKKFREGVL